MLPSILAREAKDDKVRCGPLCCITHIAPRRQDSAKFKWDFIDLNEGTIQFFASKNGKRCVSFIESRFLPVFKNFKSWLAEQGHDTTYLFPTSNAGNSGTTKVKLPHISDKSISSWLAKVRTGAAPLHGEEHSSVCIPHLSPFACHAVPRQWSNLRGCSTHPG